MIRPAEPSWERARNLCSEAEKARLDGEPFIVVLLRIAKACGLGTDYDAIDLAYRMHCDLATELLTDL